MNPVRWIKNGRMPSLWVMARAQLGLGVVSLGAGVLLGVLAALYTWGVFDNQKSIPREMRAFEGVGTQLAMSQLIAAFTFSTAGALFIFGAAVTAYLASRDDRERNGRWQGTEPPNPQGSPPDTPPPFRAPTTMLGRDRKAFEEDYRRD